MQRKDIEEYLLTDYSIKANDAAAFLVNLYASTGCKYSCSGTKIQQLLIIYQLWCFKNNKIGLLPSNDISIDLNKTLFHLDCPLKVRFYGDIIFGKVPHSKSRITDEIIIKKKISTRTGIDDFSFTNEAKELLIEIFRVFGNWSGYDFIKPQEQIFNLIKDIDPSIISINCNSLDNDIKNKLYSINNNEIINFINENSLIYNKEKKLEFDNSRVLQAIKDRYYLMSFEEKKELLIMLGIIEEQPDNNKSKIKKKIFNIHKKA